MVQYFNLWVGLGREKLFGSLGLEGTLKDVKLVAQEYLSNLLKRLCHLHQLVGQNKMEIDTIRRFLSLVVIYVFWFTLFFLFDNGKKIYCNKKPNKDAAGPKGLVRNTKAENSLVHSF